MKIKPGRLIACAVALMMYFPAICYADTSSDVEDENISETEKIDNSDEYTIRTEKQVLSSMDKVCENSNLALYYTEEEDILALVNKKNGYIWWSSPINVQADSEAKATMKNELRSTLVLSYGKSSDRTVSILRSAKNGKMKYSVSGDTLTVKYRFPVTGFVISVKYTLGDTFLSASVDTSEIEEKSENEEIILDISLLPNMTSVSSDENGYYIVPDGSGALIKFNNGKGNAKSYTSRVYGEDITSVSLTKPSVTEQITMPVYAAVKENENGLLAIIHKGDENAQLQASVSGMSKSSYNICNSKFIVRSTDTYYMNHEPLTVFEKGDIKTPELEMRFYPISGPDTDYSDIAAVYRDYLITEQEVSVKGNDMPLYINICGGTEKKEPFLGIPVTKKKAVTSFSQTEQIVTELIEKGIDSIVLRYDNWTDDGIENKVDTSASPSSVLGSKKEFKNMINFFNDNNILFYPAVNNKTFESGNGYFTFSDTAIRTSGQYSRQISYNLAYGTQDKMKDPQSLLSPDVFPDIYSALSKNYSKSGLNGICIGDMTSVLYGNYGKNFSSRYDTKNYITEGLEKCYSEIGSVLAENANAYTFKYADYITKIPLSSSKYDIFDKDIPFCQIVLHGLIPYSSDAINGDPDSEKMFLAAVAAGSGIYFDMAYEDISELKDTEYDTYFYADYSYWSNTIAGEYKFLKDTLYGLGNKFIVYFEKNDDISVTEYSDGTKVVVNYDTAQIDVNGKIYKLSDYIDMEGEVIY